MHILITGANGFVGTELCRKLLIKKYQVRGTIRHSNRISKIPAGINAIPVGSIGPDTNWSKALTGVDCVVHLAARVCITRNTADDPLELFRQVNVLGTERLAHESALANVRRFIYISSVKVNGESTDARIQKSEVRNHEAWPIKAFSEKDIPEPRDPYGISKWESEKILHKVSDETGMEVVILRSPLVYGPGVKGNFLRLLKVIDSGVPLPLASVNNKRSLIYIENLLDAIVTCIAHPRAAGNTYLVGDGEDTSTPELIRRISSELGRPARLFPFSPILLKMAGIITRRSIAIESLVRSLTVDPSKIRNELGWQTPFSMEQGLEETAKWYIKKRKERSEVGIQK